MNDLKLCMSVTCTNLGLFVLVHLRGVPWAHSFHCAYFIFCVREREWVPLV